ncbi:hypothetical protein SAY87_010974 [Trapa incisa]|uniref:Polymerase nucleotidyl transferase domain-containing protein n=1 Tax=Trapa incisa TaxID=236973 RepID=A0AAN7GRA1_9MYRT|nr:hypothetical protein SAY87_010974 [Trapa incisa]
MGKHEGWAQPPTGFLPNGLLQSEVAHVGQELDMERWSKVEERVSELISCIKPNLSSEKQRKKVSDYVQCLIVKCFPCQVCTFGSVPLKTYLPDGDIDLTIFSNNQNLKDTWAHQLRDILEGEEKNENAEFRVKEVQYIQAEVKIIKCLVENIVVDISFNQIGGLCTLCFLDEVDNLINQEHLFKRSIILIKAWCYYESRILGAHHGLISTYALETLVLYIFHVFNKKFVGPLEVLYRFLEFFSKFDWDNFCLSLWGPVPLSSLPDITAEPPRKDNEDLLISKKFLDNCSAVYADSPSGQETQGQPFISKHFNVIDPLRVNNNLGRSVNRGNFFRIRSAFTFGAKKLTKLLNCPKDRVLKEIDEFFINTWDRHGSGHRPDTPRNDSSLSGLSNTETMYGSANLQSNSITSGYVHQAEANHGSHVNHHSERSINALTRMNYSRKETSSKQVDKMEKYQGNSRADNLVTEMQGTHPFARTQSSPELTDSYSDSSQRRHNRVSEGGKNQLSSARLDIRRKNLEIDTVRLDVPSSPDGSFRRHIPSQKSIDATFADSSSVSNCYQENDSQSGVEGQEFKTVSGAHGMHQEHHGFMNTMSSPSPYGFNDQIHMLENLNVVATGYGQRNLVGMSPSNIPMVETLWDTNMPFTHGLITPQWGHYFSSLGMPSSTEDSVDSRDQNLSYAAGSNASEVDNTLWHDQDQGSARGSDLDNGSFESFHTNDHHQQSTASSNKFVPSSRISSFGSYHSHPRSSREDNITGRTDLSDAFHPSGGENEIHSRSIQSSYSSSIRNKISSENSWDESSGKVSRSSREKRGRKTSSAAPSTEYGKEKTLSEHPSAPTEDGSRDWNPAMVATEITSPGLQSVSAMQAAAQHPVAGFQSAHHGVLDSLTQLGPVLLGAGSQQKPGDNSIPFAFYPTGPPVPFLAMLPIYNLPHDTSSSEASTSQFNRDDQLDHHDSGQNLDSSGRVDHLKEINVLNNSVEQVTAPHRDLSEPKSDILDGDFASHLLNLQYGRFCQNIPPLAYPSPGVLPPVYLQGRVPWDGNPARPLSGNMNLFSQLVSYGSPPIVPVSSFQSVSNGPASIYHVDEMPRYRSGTGTYLPNPQNQKVSVRERHSSNNRRVNYGFDRSDNYSEKESNWNVGLKSRTSGRGYNRNQVDKPSPRRERGASNDSQSERPWSSSHRQNSFYHAQNSPVWSSATQGGPSNLAQYGMGPPAANLNVVSSNGPFQPVVMLYSYNHNHGPGHPGSLAAGQLDFGSLGSVGFQGMDDMSQLTDGSLQSSGPLQEEQMFHGGPASHSSPDQPSSPKL